MSELRVGTSGWQYKHSKIGDQEGERETRIVRRYRGVRAARRNVAAG